MPREDARKEMQLRCVIAARRHSESWPREKRERRGSPLKSRNRADEKKRQHSREVAKGSTRLGEGVGAVLHRGGRAAARVQLREDPVREGQVVGRGLSAEVGAGGRGGWAGQIGRVQS